MRTLSGDAKVKFKWGFIVTVLLIGLSAMSAHAVPITGGISLAGTYTTDTGNINTANAFTSFSNVETEDSSGSYAGVADGTSVTQTPFTFDPFSLPIDPLWSFMDGGLTYEFALQTGSILFQNFDLLNLTGTGILRITGFEDTVGTWRFSANQAGGTFSFSSSNAATGAVPEPGALILFGTGLIGLAGFGWRRRKKASV